MNFQQALRQLGVHNNTLTTTEKHHLDRHGYLPLENIFTPQQAAHMLSEHKKLWAIEKTGQEGGENTVVNTQNKCGSDAYDICFTHPRVIAAIAHVLREEFVSLGIHAAGPTGRPPTKPSPCTPTAAAISRPPPFTAAIRCGRWPTSPPKTVLPA